MSYNDQNLQQSLAPQTDDEGSSVGPAPVQQLGPAAKPGPAKPADQQIQPGAGSAPASGGPNPKSSAGITDPARQPSLDAACVQACDKTVSAYCAGSIDKSVATHKIIIAIFRTGRADPKHSAPWLKQLDDHDTARASATITPQGSNPRSATGTAGGDLIAPTGSPSAKRKRGSGSPDTDDSDVDFDDEEAHGRRRTYNPAAAGFRKAIFTSGPVSPHIQKTLDARGNYSADLKQAKRDVLRGGQCPPFPAELLDVVLCDNAVDFNKIYSARFSSTIGDGMQHRLADGIFIQIPARRAKKRIEDQSDWQLCFNSWFDVVCFLYPHRRAELLSYLEYVMDLFASLHKSFHNRVILADVHMRNTIHGDSRASFFDRDRLQTCALRFISPWGAEAGDSTQADSNFNGDLVQDEGDDFEEEFSTAEHSP